MSFGKSRVYSPACVVTGGEHQEPGLHDAGWVTASSFYRAGVVYINLLSVCVRPRCWGRTENEAPNRTRVPPARVFANNLPVELDKMHWQGPCQTLKKAVRSHPGDLTGHPSSLGDGTEYQRMLRRGVGCVLPWALGGSRAHARDTEGTQGILGEAEGCLSMLTHSCVHWVLSALNCFFSFILLISASLGMFICRYALSTCYAKIQRRISR